MNKAKSESDLLSSVVAEYEVIRHSGNGGTRIQDDDEDEGFPLPPPPPPLTHSLTMDFAPTTAPSTSCPRYGR